MANRRSLVWLALAQSFHDTPDRGAQLATQPEQAPESATLSPKRYRFVVAGFTVLGYLAAGMALLAPSPLLPLIIEDYSINWTTASLLITLTLLMAAGMGLPGGVIIARIGIRRAYAASWFLMTLPVLSPLAVNFAALLALRVAAGAGFVVAGIAAGPLLMQWFRLRETLVMNGLNMAALNVGMAASLFAAAPLAEALGWRGALAVFSAPSVLGAIVWIPLSRPVRETAPPSPMFSPRAVWAVISDRTVLLLVAAQTGALTQYSALTSWLPSFLNEVRGLSLNQAGFATGLLPFVGIFALLLAGFASYRLGPSRNFLIASGLLAVIGGPGAFLFGNLSGIYISIIVLGIGTHLYSPISLSLSMGLPGMTPEKLAIVWGVIFSVSSFGMFLSPLVVGVLRDTSGSFMPGFAISAASAWALIIAGLLLPRSTPGPARG